MPIKLDKFFRPWILFLSESVPSIGEIVNPPNEVPEKKNWTFAKNISLFLICTLFSICIATAVASQTLSINPDLLLWIIKIYLSILVIVWIAAALSINCWSLKLFGTWFLIVGIVATPTAVMILQTCAGVDSRTSFWFVVILWTIFAAAGLIKGKKGWSLFLAIAGAIWTISGAIATVGLISILPYSQKALGDMKSFHWFLDIRLISTVVFLCSILSTGFMLAWKRGIPDITPLPTVEFPLPKEKDAQWVQNTFGPVLVVAGVIYGFFHAILNLIWVALLTLIKFFIQIGAESTDLLKKMVGDIRSVSWVGTCLSTFFSLVVLFYLVSINASSLLYYLQENHSFPNLIDRFFLIFINTILALMLVIVLTWLIKDRGKEIANGAVKALTFLLTIIFVSGSTMLAVSRIESLDLIGFRIPGPFTVLLSLLIIAGVVYSLHQQYTDTRGKHRKA